jgi:hypothetical protein
MRRFWPWFLVVLALVPAFLIHVARPEAPNVIRRSLVVAVFDNPNSLDPAQATSLSARIAADNIFGTLFRVAANGNLSPGLASGAEVNGRHIVIHLRTVTLSDGRPLTSTIVAKSLSHVLWPTTHSPAAGLLSDVQGAAAVAQGHQQWVTGIQATGPHQLTITLVRPVPAFLYTLASPWLGIIPVSDLTRGGAFWSATDLVGSGGYRLSSWTPHGAMEFTAVSKAQSPARVQIIWYPRLNQAALSVVNGQTDVVPVPWSLLGRIRRRRLERQLLSFLPDGGQLDLVIWPAVASAWTTPGVTAAVFGRVSLGQVVDQAFLGRIGLNSGAVALLTGGGAPPPPGPGNSVGAAPSASLPALPVTVSSGDPMALRLAETLVRRDPRRFQVTVLSPSAFGREMAAGTLPAALMTMPAGSQPPSAASPTVVNLAPSGAFWLLGPGVQDARTFPDGALDWHGIR